MKKIISLVAAIIVICACAASCAPKVVKTVGGYDVDEDLDSFFGGDDEKIAEFFAVYEIADEIGCDYKSDSFAEYVEAAADRFLGQVYGGDEDALESDIEMAGMTKDVYLKVLEQDTLKNDVYEKLILDGKIESDRDKMREKFASGEALRVKRIVVTGDGAEEIIKDAAAELETKSFETVKKSYSKYAPDGEIGNYEDSYLVTLGNFDKKYEEVCFSLDVGEISDPFETDAGWCIVKRYDLTDEILDDALTDLITSYTEGQFNIMIEEKASEMMSK